MKHLYKIFAFAAVAAVALVSCNKENDLSDPNAITIRVRASVDELKGADPESKTYIGTYEGTANTILWGTGEYMKLAITAGETITFANSTDESADVFSGDPQAMFEFEINPSEASEYVYQGLYPASAAATNSNTNAANYKVNLPAIQNATASSYDPAAYIMVAKPETFTTVQTEWVAWYRRATALNKITLKNFASSVSINKVKITAEGKKLAGGRHFNLTTGEGLEVYGTDATIEVLYATPLTGTSMDIWFTSWDAEIAEGEKLTVIAYTTDGESYTKEITVPAGRSIKFQEGYLNNTGVSMSGITPEEVTTIEGDFVILAKNNDTYYALKGEASGTRIASVDYTGSTTSYAGDASIIWTIAPSGSSYTITNNGNYVGWNGGTGSSANNAGLIAEADYDADKCLMTIDKDGDVYHIKVSAEPTRTLAKNTGSAYFAFYASTGQYSDIVLVPATALETVATPTFSPAAGEVTSGTEVAISCATSGATIHYTIDGTDPTSSSATYSSPIAITATTTIKAIAVKSGMADSAIATATYSVTSAGSVTLTEDDITAGSNTAKGTNNSVLAYRLGTTSNNGSLTFPAGYSTITFTLAGWASGTRFFSITNGEIAGSETLYPEAGSPSGTINAGFNTTYSGTEYTIEVTDPTQEVVFTGRRCIVWGFTAVSAGPSVTWNLASISITTAPTKTTYTAGETFDPAGMVVTGHFVDASNSSNTKDEAVTGYTISPNGALAITDDHVTITYQGKTATQAITVNAAPVVTYDFETVAELNTLVTSSGDNTKNNDAVEYSGKLTSAVVSYVPNTDNAIIKDATGSILVFKSSHGLLQGQTFSGEVTVSAKLYFTTVEITALNASFSGLQTEVLPATMTLSQLEGNFGTYQNAYVKLENLTVNSRNGKTITVSNGGKTYIIYDNEGLSTTAAGDVITAIGTVADHNGTNQIKVWSSENITFISSVPRAITFSQPSAGGSFIVKVGGSNITSGTTVASGTTVTLTATAASNYSFGSWDVNGATVADATAATTTFTMGTSPVSINAVFTSNGGGQETPSLKYTLTPIAGSNSSYTGNCDITIDNIIWNISGNSQMIPWRLGGKSITSVDRAIYSKTAISSNISQIVITHAGASSITVNSMKVYVCRTAAGAAASTPTNVVASFTPAFVANGNVTIDKADNTSWAGCFYRIVYNVTVSGTSNKFIAFSEAKFYGTN